VDKRTSPACRRPACQVVGQVVGGPPAMPCPRWRLQQLVNPPTHLLSGVRRLPPGALAQLGIASSSPAGGAGTSMRTLYRAPRRRSKQHVLGAPSRRTAAAHALSCAAGKRPAERRQGANLSRGPSEEAVAIQGGRLVPAPPACRPAAMSRPIA
jgi:hypothetical protein